ncbi:MltA domain-containing protein [Burkholderiaceae bacterium DAT-1]|nr:MltA domain-containing protein [Burkholderiaceae bacterium DAT-1]
MPHFSIRLALASIAAITLFGCATRSPMTDIPEPVPPPVKPQPVTAQYEAQAWSSLPGWTGSGLLAAWPAWLESCKVLEKQSAWTQACRDAKALSPKTELDVRSYFEANFKPWQISSSEPSGTKGLITGYYEPMLTGSRSNSKGRFPLYAVPDDLLTIDLGNLYPDLKNMRLRGRLVGNKVVPYWSRADIEEGKAPLNSKVLAWIDDPVELFFLQIQGSGRIKLEDGKMLRVGYADQNGHPYKSIGKWLIEQGELKASEASMQGIQAWASSHPERLKELLNTNPSYVFFRELPKQTGGPLGALGVPLTDAVSVAVDRRYVPLGAPLFLSSTWPNDDSRPLQRMVIAQDTGGAIRGPVRLDYFWGFGPEAGLLAGRMKQKGEVWMIWPNNAPPPSSSAINP